MAYFPHAFKKVFTPIAGGFINNGTAKTADLTAGQFGFFNYNTYTNVATANASIAANPVVILAQGSFHPNDKIGPFHGGYKESIKSKGINPRYIHRFYKVLGRAGSAQNVKLGWDGIAASAATIPTFMEGDTYSLRVDIKGSPVLRFLGRNAYKTVDFLKKCGNLNAPAQIDPIVVFLDLAKQINEDPIVSKFINAKVFKSVAGAKTLVSQTAAYTPDATPATVKGSIELDVIYADSTFGDDSFDTKDHYELEPVEITSAQFVDETGDPCSGFSQISFINTAAVQAQGSAERLIREVILDARYRQEPFTLDKRRQQIEGQLNTIFGASNRTGRVDSYYILHSVPRKANPSSTLDSDQYLVEIAVPAGTSMTGFEAWMAAYLTSANTGVVLETVL
jgi:hypothetical protein